MSDSETKPVLLTCAQPSNQLHLGNYLGAVNNWRKMQEDYTAFFGIVDLHAMTIPYVPSDLRKNSIQCVAQYIACGLDPEKCSIFIQSHVHEHTELAWVLACLTPLGQLERMTQFKDKSKKVGSINAGLLYYPVLQAADILLYNADCVAVGEDQKQHIELTRDLAQKFNHTYSETFKLPEIYIGKHGARIMAMQEPGNKMSKSDKNTHNTLFLFESIDLIRKKIMSAVTDSGSDVRAGEDKPGISNLLQILSIATEKPISEIEGQFAGSGYAPFKQAVADAVIALIEPLQSRYQEISNDKDYLNTVIQQGAENAKRQARKTLSKVYRKAGLVPRS